MKQKVQVFIAAAAGVILIPPASGQSSNPSVDQCVTRLTREVDRPFRLSQARAMQRCEEIARRIRSQASQMLGTWTRQDEEGRTETMTFLDDGTAQVRSYSNETQRMEEAVRPWAFVNPYGSVGSESLDFYPYLVGVEFAGNMMTISHQPTSSQNAWTERWTRVDSPLQEPRHPNVAAWVLPVQPSGNVSRFFDPIYPHSQNRQHLGLDLPVPPQTPVLSPVSGLVVANLTSAADVMQAYLIISEDGTGAEHVLGHIASALRVGQHVDGGQVVGSVRAWPGEPGRSHVHWGANRNGVRAAIGASPQGDWGWGRAPAAATQAQAEARGWIDLNSLLAGAAATSPLPPADNHTELRQLLATHYPGWQLQRASTELCDPGQDLAASVTGDFNGDQVADHLVRIVRGQTGKIVAFVSQGDEFAELVLEEMPSRDIIYMQIGVARAGTMQDVDLGARRIRLRYDAPTGGQCSTSSWIYVIEGGTFRRAFTSD